MSSFTFLQNLSFTSQFVAFISSFMLHIPSISQLYQLYLQNAKCRHPHSYYSGPSHHHLKSVFSQSPFNWSPYFHLCPSPIIYTKLGNQSNILKHKSCPVTPQLKTLWYLSLALRIKSFLWPRSPYLTWGFPPLLLYFLMFFPQFTLCHALWKSLFLDSYR